MKSTLVLLLSLIALLSFSSCGDNALLGGGESTTDGNGSSNPDPTPSHDHSHDDDIACTPLTAVRDEPDYCGTSQALSGPTLSGSATFQARKPNASGLGAPGAPEPIRYAEVQVFNSEEELVQCGETDGSGNYSFSLPDEAGDYEVMVVSRGRNEHVSTSVLQDPTYNRPHFISTTVTYNGSDSTISAGTINASAADNSELKGGAFNIFEQVVRSNEFLAATSQACASDGCEVISPAAHSTIYWKKGVTPTTYFNLSGPLSFFSACDDALFILGGLNGNTNATDTDHFDNSIIIHEYGHFIEDHYAGTDTPGGPHDGNSVIDPRLAWGEGWANFFQAAVTGDPIYIDTEGNIDGTTQFIFKENLEDPQHDIPLLPGEGNFREFSISRGLWDMIDPHPFSAEGTNEGAGTDLATIGFGSLWTVFTVDFRSNDTRFRNYGLFMQKLLELEPTANLESILEAENQKATQEDYVQPVFKTGTCSDYSITGRTNPNNPNLPDWFASFDYFQYEHPGGNLNVELVYESANDSDPSDLDLYVYYETHVLGSQLPGVLVGSSDACATPTSSCSADDGTEAVSANVAAGHYMILVNQAEGADVPLGSGATYSLEIDGVKVCP